MNNSSDVLDNIVIQFAWSLVPEVNNTKWTYSDTLQSSNKTWNAHWPVNLNWLKDLRQIFKLRFKQDNSGSIGTPRKNKILYVPMSLIGKQDMVVGELVHPWALLWSQEITGV